MVTINTLITVGVVTALVFYVIGIFSMDRYVSHENKQEDEILEQLKQCHDLLKRVINNK